jgi:hypothetical protein
MMSRLGRVAKMAVIALTAAVISGCGGGSGSGGVVAQVGGTPITQATLNHWVATFIRGDYYQVIAKKAPAGLATDPPDYRACVGAAKSLAPIRNSGKPILGEAQLGRRCRQLYQDVRLEALSWLISVLWQKGQAAERGEQVTDAALERNLDKWAKEKYGTRQALMAYLDKKGWSLADLHYILKRNLLSELNLIDLHRKATRVTTDPAGIQKALLKYLLKLNARWTSKTSCGAGYVVWQCKEYTPRTSTNPSPAVLFEEMSVR